MKQLMSLLTASVLAISGFSLTGCATNGLNTSRADQLTTAGGNGAFGEDAAQPGAYSVDQHNSPTTQPSASR